MTYPNLLTTDEKADLEDAEELQAHRDGIGHLAEDPMHAGQPVHAVYIYADDETKYWLQITHADMPLWNCMCCGKLSISQAGTARPERCAGCGEHPDCLTPLIYEGPAACRSWAERDGGGYDGPCLIAGSDGCEC